MIMMITAWRKFIGTARFILLMMVLSLIYFMILTPIAWRKTNRDSEWRHSIERTRWHVNEQSTSDSRIYKNSSGRDEFLDLIRERGDDNSALQLYDVLNVLRFLAEPPKEKELSSDLYVIF
jgi:hypothetical protein